MCHLYISHCAYVNVMWCRHRTQSRQTHDYTAQTQAEHCATAFNRLRPSLRSEPPPTTGVAALLLPPNIPTPDLNRRPLNPS